MAKPKRCPECTHTYPEVDDLYEHIEEKHSDAIPKGMSAGQYFYFTKYHRKSGQCVVCSKETPWNESTNKPYRICSPICRKTYRENFLNNMRRVHGKDHLLNDPEMQKKMLSQRSISGEYQWSNGARKGYVGSYEKDFLRFLDVFMNFEPDDIHAPAPQIIEYEYEGEKHFYIPDFYIESINTIVEIKDGGDNPNTHHKIQNVDKEKEKAKDGALSKTGKYNYIKIVNKQYGAFIKFLLEIRNSDQDEKRREVFHPVVMINENMQAIQESVVAQKDLFLAIVKQNVPGLSEEECGWSIWFSFDSTFDTVYKSYPTTDKVGDETYACAKFTMVDKSAVIGDASFNIMKLKQPASLDTLYKKVQMYMNEPMFYSTEGGATPGLDIIYLFDDMQGGRCFDHTSKNITSCSQLIQELGQAFQYIMTVPNLNTFDYNKFLQAECSVISEAVMNMNIDELYDTFIGTNEQTLSECDYDAMTAPTPQEADNFDANIDEFENYIRHIGKTAGMEPLHRLGAKIKNEFTGSDDQRATLMRRLAHRKEQMMKVKS